MSTSKRILVVENDPATVQQIQDAFKRMPYDLRIALTVEEALDMLEHEEMDLVLTGLKMPGMSGLDFLHELRAWDTGLPVILMSHKAQGRVQLEALKAQANATISKPIKKAPLLKIIAQAFHPNPTTLPELNF